MKPFRATGLLIILALPFGAAIADDAVALEYAQDAVKTLRAEFDGLKGTLPVYSSQMQQLQSDLHNAELTLFHLQGDDAGVKRLLRAEVNRQSTLFKQQQSFADRGYAGAKELSTSELRLLVAQCNLARHIGDQATAALAIRRAIEVEESKLKSILHQASSGYANQSSIAKQKLRIAQLIATKTITPGV